MSIHSYPKIHNTGHRFVQNLFSEMVFVEEKVDGSQFSMMVNADGDLECRSKGVMIDLDNPGMFDKAVQSAREREDLLKRGYVYRGEYLRVPKHNTLTYARVPHGNIIIFDIQQPDGDYLRPLIKRVEAGRISLETVPCLWDGVIPEGVDQLAFLKGLLGRESHLGGCNIEGVVVKNYEAFTPDHDPVFMKVVDFLFREKHAGEWKVRNPGRKDIVQQLCEQYCNENRWAKAVQHLRDDGKLKGELSDIGPLLKAVCTDIHDECADEIKEALFKVMWRDIAKGATRGLPEWYRAQVEQGGEA